MDEMAEPEMRRPFTILDLMILVGAVALALTLFQLPSERLSVAARGGLRYNRIALKLVAATVPILLALTCACLVIRLAGPHPAWSGIRQQPGFVACAMAVLALSYESFWLVSNGLVFGWDAANRGFLPGAEGFFILIGREAPTWITAAWITLLIVRRWRAEPSWIDRLGRTIGVCWLLAGVIARGSVLLVAL